MDTILKSATKLLDTSLDGPPARPIILDGLVNSFESLSAMSADVSGLGIFAWLAELRQITASLADIRIHQTLVVRALQMHAPRVAEALTLAGVIVIDWEDPPGAQPKPEAFAIDWERFNALTTDPGATALNALVGKAVTIKDVKTLQVLLLMLATAPKALMELEYQRQGFAALPLSIEPVPLLDQLIALIQSPLRIELPFDLPLSFQDLLDNASSTAAGPMGFLAIDGSAAFNQLDDLALEVRLNLAEEINGKILDLGNGWTLKFETNGAGAQSYRVQFGLTGLDASIRPATDLAVTVNKTSPGANALLVGETGGTHLSIRSLGAGVRLRATGPLFEATIQAENIALTLKPDFLSFLSFGLDLPALLNFESSFKLNYAQGQGLSGQFERSALPAITIRQVLPLNFKIGSDAAGVQLDQVVAELQATVGQGGLQFLVTLRYGAQGQFGPLKAIMDGAGVSFGRWNGVNGGPVLPQGIGLSLKAGPVSGGGFLSIVSASEFAGALQLKIMGIGAFAYGLYKTLPSGDPSFVALIGIRLPLPGVQIGFGFAISGFGGLVGINRRADTDLLRERLASGAAGDVLFNDDPMKNAPKLLGDMQAFFPSEDGVFLIGPTLQINWLYILKLDVGVFIELPGPRKFFIAGSARLVIGSEEFALVYLRMDFIGGADFTKSLIFFDAALTNSHVLGVFRITGGVALRLAYGENSYFLFTVGGFHPSFNPGSMELPKVAKVGCSFSLGPVWLKQEMYLAITSNTFQLGSRVEAGLDLGPISAHGWFGFDALIQFKPFHFIATVDAGFDVEVADVSLCSVRIQGLLSGPGPLVLQARASVKILFVRISGSLTIELGSNPPEHVVPIPNIPLHLKDELSRRDNLRIEGEDGSVRIMPLAAEANLVSPVGALVWEQKRTPLNLAIEKLEGIELGGWHTITVSSGLPQTKEEDWFGVGTYLKLADGEALNNPRFAQQQSGLRTGSEEMATGGIANGEIKVSLVKLPKPVVVLDPVLLPIALYVSQGLSEVLRDKTGGAVMTAGEPKVLVQQESWIVHSGDGTIDNTETLNAVQAFVNAKQLDGFALPATELPLNLTGVF